MKDKYAPNALDRIIVLIACFFFILIDKLGGQK